VVPRGRLPVQLLRADGGRAFQFAGRHDADKVDESPSKLKIFLELISFHCIASNLVNVYRKWTCRAVHGFCQAKFYGISSVLGSSQISILLQVPQKILLDSKVVKIDQKNNHLAFKSVTHFVCCHRTNTIGQIKEKGESPWSSGER